MVWIFRRSCSIAVIAGVLVGLAWGGDALGAGGRQYEMVSPVDKGGADVLDGAGLIALGGGVQSTPSGESIAYAAASGFGGSPSSLISTYYMSSRDGSTWSTQPLNPPLAPTSDNLVVQALYANSSDLATSLVGSRQALAPGAVQGDANLYRRDNVSGVYEFIATSPQTPFAQTLFGLGTRLFADATPDFGTIVLATVGITPDAPAGQSSVYTWRDGDLRLASILPDNTVDPSGAAAGDLFANSRRPHVISQDGSRVFFTSPAGSGGVYMREGDHTVAVSASQRAGDPPGAATARFRGATADGSAVFFTSPAPLTDASRGTSADLYRYDVNTRRLTNLTAGPGVGDPGGAQLGDVLRVSDDGSYVYFIAFGALAPGATSGQPNIYLLRGGTMRFVATIDPFEPLAVGAAGQLTSDSGRYLMFLSDRRLTSYDNAGTTEVYLYDGDTGDLRCASCDPSGKPPTGPASIGGRVEAGYPSISARYPRAMLDDGRVLFNSPDALVPQDTNGKNDVYEYGDARLTLISSGRSASGSVFADASASGDDVFFFTRERLVGQDVDDNTDLYDARVGGGLAGQNPGPSGLPPCAGDDCRSPLQSAPVLPTIASIDFAGAGNATATPVAPRRGIQVSKKAFARGNVVIRVSVPKRGRLVVSGAAIHTTRRGVSRAGSYQLVLRLTSQAKRQLARRHRLRIRFRVGFTPTGGTPSGINVTALAKAK